MTPSLIGLVDLYVADRTNSRRFRRSTAKSTTSVLLCFVAVVGKQRDPRKLRREDIERWMASRPDIAPGTLRNQLSCVRAWCNWLIVTGRMKHDPTIGVERIPQPRYVPRAVPPNSVAALLDACPDERATLIISLMCQEGLRCCEVASLQINDIDMAERVLRVAGKGGHERVLPITRETYRQINAYLALYPAMAGPLIRSFLHPNRGLTPSYIGDMIRSLMYGAGVKRHPRDSRSAHALRHTAATDVLRAGAHIRDVQQMLGHVSLATTQRYMPLVVGNLRDAMDGRRYATTK